MVRWYYARNRERFGPVSFEELQRLAGAGEIQSTDYVYQEGMAGWVTASSVAGLLRPQAISAATVEPLEAYEVPVTVRHVPAGDY